MADRSKWMKEALRTLTIDVDDVIDSLEALKADIGQLLDEIINAE